MRELLRAGWKQQDSISRWILAVVIGMTIAGMGASMLTSYALPWRILRFVVDTLFLIALLTIVATPAAMRRPEKRLPAKTRPERTRRALQIAGEIVLRFFTLVLAVAIFVGLLTAHSGNPAIVIWRLCTAASAAIVLNSRLLNALWSGGRGLRLISTAIAGIEIVAFVATLSIDIPAILQSADLATDRAVAKITAEPGSSSALADIVHYLGPRPFSAALDGVLAIPRSHQTLDCAITGNHDPPTSGYRSQKGVVDYVLQSYVECSRGLGKLESFVENLPAEATPAERADDVRRCGNVAAGAAYSAIDALHGHPVAQARIKELTKRLSREGVGCESRL